MAIPDLGAHNYALLSLSPLSGTTHAALSKNALLAFAKLKSVERKSMSEWFPTARLACLIHAANVHSEPESNPSIGYIHQHRLTSR